MTTFTDIPIAKIKPHPHNVRRDAVADDELIDSVKEQGILQPIGVVPDGKAYLLIAGHRRLAAAKGAKLKTVPAIVLDHLTTEAQQIEAMLVENGRRVDLTAIEEADAYEQLALIGYDAAQIAKATGRASGTVTSRLKLAHLTKKAKEAIHVHEMTIEDGIKLASLEANPALLKKVENAIGTNDFHWQLRSAVSQIEREIDQAKLRAKYEKGNLPKIEKPKDGWDYTNGPHPVWGGDDKADAWAEDGDRGPVLVLTKTKDAKSETAIAKEKRRRELEEQKRKDALKAGEIARRLRLEHVAGLTAGLKFPAPLLAHVRLATARIVASMTATEVEDAIAASGLSTLKRAKNDYHNDVIAAQILQLNTPDLLRLFGIAIAAEASGHLYVGYGQMAGNQAQNAVTYWEAFLGSGYVLPDVDEAARKKVTEQLEAKPTEGNAA